MAPLFAETDAPLLKTYIMNRLESASEADPDVLSDYILALLRHDQAPAEVMASCITQLADFMTSDPTGFVKDIFEVLATKSYLQRETRKRSFGDVSQSSTSPHPNKFPRQQPHQQYPSSHQPVPQQAYPYPTPQPVQQHWPGVPPSRVAPWPGQGPPPPGWNATAPVGPPLIPQQAWPVVRTPPAAARPKIPRIKGTCFDYLEKGVCLRGAACPYDHGIAPAVISPTGEIEGRDSYDPLHPSITTSQTPLLPVTGARPSIQVNKFETLKGPSHDKSNTSLVIEGIPQDKLNEAAIRTYFSQFGPLTGIHLNPPRSKALLTYTDHESASRAWNDPRPVFNNRFVKIFWKRSDTEASAASGLSSSNGARVNGARGELSDRIVDEVELEVAREAVWKAQREHEEKMRRKEELEKKKEELERKRVELMEQQKVERERLMEKIRRAKEKQLGKSEAKTSTPEAAKTAESEMEPKTEMELNGAITNGDEKSGEENKPDDERVKEKDLVEDKETTGNGDEESARKAHLQKMLSDLQNQANALNIPPSEYTLPPLSDSTRTKSRGSYRGRGAYPTRGRGRGRGGMTRSLDLRPKAILVSEIMGSEKETAIREWLIMNCADAVCDVAEEDERSLVIKFRERYEAEEFLQNLLGPTLGPVSGTWYVPPTSTNTPSGGNFTAAEEGAEMEVGDGDGMMGKEYVYDEEEEGEVRESEGRWKR